MVNITEKDGVILLSGEFDMKIDNNRVVYVKKSQDNIYKRIEEIPQGYTSEQKKKYLYGLYVAILRKLNEAQEQTQENKNQNFY